ncbi:uncharacterized protein HKW66_Vig0127140 [Vigna angularis]|uniref:Uncharacterized protein n=1 Tax=Phaseolus angularis TaxID=3914 RepID=A0A8T0K758_PHAAN|nr:uncharacterized protein HKW66_Vig0127140 [Vigna angularis]
MLEGVPFAESVSCRTDNAEVPTLSERRNRTNSGSGPMLQQEAIALASCKHTIVEVEPEPIPQVQPVASASATMLVGGAQPGAAESVTTTGVAESLDIELATTTGVAESTTAAGLAERRQNHFLFTWFCRRSSTPVAVVNSATPAGVADSMSKDSATPVAVADSVAPGWLHQLTLLHLHQLPVGLVVWASVRLPLCGDSAIPAVVADSVSKDFITPVVVDNSAAPGCATVDPVSELANRSH